MKAEYFPFIFFGLAILFLGWRWFRAGSFTGAILGARIQNELGEIQLDTGSFQSQKLRVFTFRDSNGASRIGLAWVAKAPLGASMQIFRLTPEQARWLSDLLTRACVEP